VRSDENRGCLSDFSAKYRDSGVTTDAGKGTLGCKGEMSRRLPSCTGGQPGRPGRAGDSMARKIENKTIVVDDITSWSANCSNFASAVSANLGGILAGRDVIITLQQDPKSSPDRAVQTGAKPPPKLIGDAPYTRAVGYLAAVAIAVLILSALCWLANGDAATRSKLFDYLLYLFGFCVAGVMGLTGWRGRPPTPPPGA
jgi:hypothetical protein